MVQAREGERDESESRLERTTKITWQNLYNTTIVVD